MDKVSCIYCIVHKLDNEMDNIYFGSTKDLCDRKRNHKIVCNNETSEKYNFKVYQYIRENGGMENFQFIILEECEVEKLKRLEQSYMDVYKPSLNMSNANGLDIERHIANTKEWYENNKEYKLQQYKEYYQKNKEYINIRRKQYIIDYYEKNKERQNEKFNCECGGKYTRSKKARHERSKKHQAYITQSSQS